MAIIFKDEWNPTSEEISEWAYSDAAIPDEDWELAINCLENISMICSFVDDENCIKTSFFLSSLYVFTGDIVRQRKLEEIEKLSFLLEEIEKIAKSKKLKSWIERSNYLIENPESYEYAYWGLGSKYAYDY